MKGVIVGAGVGIIDGVVVVVDGAGVAVVVVVVVVDVDGNGVGILACLLLLIQMFSIFHAILLSYTMIYLYPSSFEYFDFRYLKSKPLIILFKVLQNPLTLK